MNARIQRIKERLATHVMATGIALVLAGFTSFYALHQSRAAVDVRPELAEVSFITALLTQHGTDWLFYHYPTIGTAVFVALWMVSMNIALLFMGGRGRR